MPVSAKQLLVLFALRRYFYCDTPLIRALVYPDDKDGSVTRDTMRTLVKLGLVRRYEQRLLAGNRTSMPLVFVLTLKGAAVLAEAMGDVRLLLTVEPTFGAWMSIFHFTELARFMARIDASVAKQDRVTIGRLYYEHEVVAPDEADPSKKFPLHTVVSNPGEKRIPCCPDCAFEVMLKNWRRAVYVELEMGSDTPGRVAAKKHQGYFGLFKKQLWKRHFPDANDARVLAVCPYESFRDALRREMKSKPGAESWLFVCVKDVTAEAFLTKPILYTVEKGPFPFVPAPAGAPVASSSGGVPAGAEGGAAQ